MIKDNDRMVYRRPSDGKWVNKKNTSSHATSVHKTQADALGAARQNLIIRAVVN